MTTENIKGLEGIEELIGKISTDVASRPNKIREELKGRDRHERNLALGAAAAMQKSLDKRALLEEELEQMNNIGRMADSFLVALKAPSASAADDNDDTRAVPAAPASAPATPAPTVPVAPAPAPAPPVDDTLVAPAPVVRDTPANVNVFVATYNTVRNFTWIQWILAVIFALIGLRIGLATDDFGFSSGPGYWLKEVLWLTGATLAGFAIGGFLGSLIDDFRARRDPLTD